MEATYVADVARRKRMLPKFFMLAVVGEGRDYVPFKENVFERKVSEHSCRLLVFFPEYVVDVTDLFD